jgi:hypothetical protein
VEYSVECTKPDRVNWRYVRFWILEWRDLKEVLLLKDVLVCEGQMEVN